MAPEQAGADDTAYHMPYEVFPGVGHSMMADIDDAKTARYFNERAAVLAVRS